MADLRIVDAPVLLQESITDDVKMPTGGLGNFSVRLGDILWYVITKEQLANKSYVDLSSKGVKDSLDEHIADKANPHNVTKAQVGLGNVDNTADTDKPVSNATKSAIITATTDMATKVYVNSKDGDLSALLTTDKTSLVKAINEVVSVKANKDDVALSISNLTNNKADKSTTLEGYGITDAYTKSEIDTNYGGVKTLYDKNVAAGAGANGWTTDSVVEDGLTQKLINAAQKLKNSEAPSIADYGAIGDGKMHTVQEWCIAGAVHYKKYENLSDIQADYPHVTALTDSIDWAATQKALNVRASTGGGKVKATAGHYMFKPVNNSPALSIPDRVTLVGNLDETIFEMITDSNDDPDTSVNWDFLQFSGSENSGGGAQQLRLRQTGGRRNNCAVIAVRNGAKRKKIIFNIIESAIGSGVILEGSISNPMQLRCKVTNNDIANTGRHGTYVIGATHNTVRDNQYDNTGLESVALRMCTDNDILDNDFFAGDNAVHAIALAAPPSGQRYSYKRLKIKGNRVFGYKGAGFYGQGVGCSLYDSDISNNTINLLDDGSVTAHAMMIYRATDCKFNNNIIYGGRNRAIMMYGCKRNEITGNNIKNVNSAGNAVGCIVLVDYTDIDGKTFSTGNTLSRNVIVDDRDSPKHVYGIQCLSGSNNNTFSKNTIEGNTSTKIVSADGLDKQKIGVVVEKFQWYTPTALAAGGVGGATTALTQIPVVGNTYVSVVNTAAYLKQLRLTTRQIATGGTITANLYKNGGFLFSVVLNGDGAKTTTATQFTENQIDLVVGDALSISIKADNLTSGQSSIDCTVHAVTAI